MTIAALLFALIVTSSAEETREPVLLDFHASWCGPCKQMRPAVDLLIKNRYPVKSIDIDEHPELAARYKVEAVPTFIVIDNAGRQLARTEGYQPATQLSEFYRRAATKTRALGVDSDRIASTGRSGREAEVQDDPPEEGAESEEDDQSAPAAVNPDPWKTVVRIKIQGNGSIGFGSGTIIYSDADQSIILTCAHIFKVEGTQPTHPSRFSRPIMIDLFDGTLHSQRPAQVHYVESVPGKAIDYDFGLDVGLIRIRPGRKLPASRVVPPSWTPQPGMKMTTVGCSEGADATAWSTSIIKPLMRGLSNSPNYEAIECYYAPKQGRSGGGLYTIEGYVAGVCDFAEPRGNHGLYATPHSIYSILSKNQLTALYLPAHRQGGTLLANNRSGRTRAATAPSIARAQSPDTDESGRVTIPPPELLGIEPPAVAQNAGRQTRQSRSAWHSASAAGEPAERTDLSLSPEVDNDRFQERPAPEPSEERVARSNPTRGSGSSSRFKWRPVREPSVPLSASNQR